MKDSEVVVKGRMNTKPEVVVEHVKQNIRRPLPQARPYDPQDVDVILALGGPSLAQRWDALEDLYYDSCRLVTVNGTHDYCIDRGLRPAIHVMVDARKKNADFLKKPLSSCRYLVASQCHPAIFEALEGQNVTIFHSDYTETDLIRPILKHYYFDRFYEVVGGSTVGLRSILLLRMLGFSRIHVFGMDSCWMDGKHHAYPQGLNDKDKQLAVKCGGREFIASPWHIKQAQEFRDVVKIHGDKFQLKFHGKGLIATMVRHGNEFTIDEDSDNGSRSVGIL